MQLSLVDAHATALRSRAALARRIVASRDARGSEGQPGSNEPRPRYSSSLAEAPVPKMRLGCSTTRCPSPERDCQSRRRRPKLVQVLRMTRPHLTSQEMGTGPRSTRLERTRPTRSWRGRAAPARATQADRPLHAEPEAYRGRSAAICSMMALVLQQGRPAPSQKANKGQARCVRDLLLTPRES
jgi:hypothetical protein